MGNIFSWNVFVKTLFFIIIVVLINVVKEMYINEGKSALTDALTGVANRRKFFNFLKMEINRLKRYNTPFTIAYIDIDGF